MKRKSASRKPRTMHTGANIKSGGNLHFNPEKFEKDIPFKTN